jgi:hypothetical protein
MADANLNGMGGRREGKKGKEEGKRKPLLPPD